MTAPVLLWLLPNGAVMGGPDLTLRVIGDSFDPGAVILWNDSPEPTTWVSATELNTTVKPSTASVYNSSLVKVQNPTLETSFALAFTFYPVGYCPVAPEEVAAVLGPGTPVDARMIEATQAACELARGFLDPPEDWVWPDPLPSRFHEGIVGLALDLYRSPTFAFGYFATDLGIAPTGPDVMRRWRQHFSNDRMGYGFA
jgi:hypothetical protein